jgi:hypothetical protein
MQLGAEVKFTVGTGTLFDSTAAKGSVSVVFEDDGTTGYLYAMEPSDEMRLLDALHIYNVADVEDRQLPVTAQLFWTVEETAVALLINGYCHALYDFQRQAGFCRNAFPPAQHGQLLKRELTDELLEQYFAA